MLVLRRVVGHSMMPVLPPGTVVVGRRWFRAIKPGSIIVYNFAGKEKIKRAVKVIDQHVYVLGDNPYDSYDSRSHGAIPATNVLAVIIWPRDPK